jgi:hypothetical protein
MLFITHWELNQNISGEERTQIAQKLTSSGKYPPEGVKILNWYSTPDGWGVTVFEAENEMAAIAVTDMWRMAGAGFFRLTRTAPAVTVEEHISASVKMAG